jgi:hypothetical protein
MLDLSHPVPSSRVLWPLFHEANAGIERHFPQFFLFSQILFPTSRWHRRRPVFILGGVKFLQASPQQHRADEQTSVPSQREAAGSRQEQSL